MTLTLDANALLIVVLGYMDPHIIEHHKRTSIYQAEDFNTLLELIQRSEEVLILPNVWTEVDNLLNNFRGERKYRYYLAVKTLIQSTSEVYLPTEQSLEPMDRHFNLGIADSLLLTLALRRETLLITGDSRLSDYAKTLGIRVFDVVENRNARL